MWYPTTASGERVRFANYVGSDRDGLSKFLTGAGLATSTVDSLFESPLHAIASAPPSPDSVPLILVAQGNGQNAADQVVLCEYLASHGFAVATTPSPMRRKPMEREDQMAEFAETQASELLAAIPVIATTIPVDTMRIGVVGHSFGARPALLMAMRSPNVRAIVSLDGGIGTATAVELFRAAPSFRQAARIPPLLHFYETLDSFMKPDFTLLESLTTAQLVLTPTQHMHHSHFTTYGFAAATFPSIAKVTRATAGTRAAVNEVLTATLAFLERHLARTSSAHPAS